MLLKGVGECTFSFNPRFSDLVLRTRPYALAKVQACTPSGDKQQASNIICLLQQQLSTISMHVVNLLFHRRAASTIVDKMRHAVLLCMPN
jgi:hypothetical protein